MTRDRNGVDLLRQAREQYTQQEIASHIGVDIRTVQRWEAGEVRLRPMVLPALQELIQTPETGDTESSEFTFIDLFAGIGGIRLAFESIGGRCIYTSEYDRHCKETYRANFSINHPFDGDITQVNEKHIPRHDILLAGFPCQPFSIAGVSKKNSLGRPHGFSCSTQGTLFFDVARIIAHHRPRAFLLENVKNLQSHDGGKTFSVIMETLQNELGYKVYPRVIDGRGFVPQHRERIYIVGFRDRNNFSWDGLRIPDTAARTMSDILHPENGSEKEEFPYTEGPRAKVSNKYVLSDHLWRYLQEYAKKHREKGNGFGFGLVGPGDVARTLSARYYKDGSEILVSRKGNPRRLTPRECARLMGFDSGKHRFRIPVSDTQAYRQFGNSVVVPVVSRVARLMKPHIAGQKALRNRAGR